MIFASSSSDEWQAMAMHEEASEACRMPSIEMFLKRSKLIRGPLQLGTREVRMNSIDFLDHRDDLGDTLRRIHQEVWSHETIREANAFQDSIEVLFGVPCSFWHFIINPSSRHGSKARSRTPDSTGRAGESYQHAVRHHLSGCTQRQNTGGAATNADQHDYTGTRDYIYCAGRRVERS